MHLARRTFISAGLLALASASAATRADSQESQRLVQFNKGVVAFTQEQYQEAERIFKELVSAQEDDLGARYWLGLCQLQLNEHQQASESFRRVLEQVPERTEVQLDYAIALIGQDDFKRGRDVLREYVATKPDDPVTLSLAQFFLGLSEYKLGNYDAALEAFDQAEAGQPSEKMQGNIAFYRSLTYYEQRKLAEAASELERAGKVTTDDVLQARARTLAAQVQRGSVDSADVSPLQLRVDFGFSYDTNVVLLGNGASTPIDISGQEDFRFGLTTDVKYLKSIGEKWLLGLGGNTYNSWHASLNEYNVQTYGGRVFVNYFADDRITLGLQYEYDYTLVDNDAFLARNRVTPSLRLVEAVHEDGTALTASTVFYAYEDRNYHDELERPADDRDGDYQAVGMVQSFNVCQPRLDQGDGRWLSGAIGYQFLDESTQGDNFDMSGNVLTARLAVPLPQDFLFEFAGRWTWEHYWNPNTEDYRRRKRHDFVQRYVWGVSRVFELDRNISMELSGHIAYTVDDSNVRNRLGEAVYSYDRVIYGLTFSFFFR